MSKPARVFLFIMGLLIFLSWGFRLYILALRWETAHNRIPTLLIVCLSFGVGLFLIRMAVKQGEATRFELLLLTASALLTIGFWGYRLGNLILYPEWDPNPKAHLRLSETFLVMGGILLFISERARFKQRRAVGILLLFLWCTLLSRVSSALETRSVSLPSGRSIIAEISDTDETRSRGLMFRDHLAKDRGMLFIFPTPGRYPFWMKNCRFSIDIIWLDKNKKIVHVSERTPPCKSDPCPLYKPDKKDALYVLEVAAGLVAKEGLTRGMQVQF